MVVWEYLFEGISDGDPCWGATCLRPALIYEDLEEALKECANALGNAL